MDLRSYLLTYNLSLLLLGACGHAKVHIYFTPQYLVFSKSILDHVMYTSFADQQS